MSARYWTGLLVATLLATTLPGGALAGDIATDPLSRSELTDRIVAAGTSAAATRATGVEIDGCLITTSVYEPHGRVGWVLDVFVQFDLARVTTIDMPQAPHGARYYDSARLGFAMFQAIPPYKVRQVVPELVRDEAALADHAHGGVPGRLEFNVDEQERFIVIMKNVTDPDKASDFARGLMRYRDEYCLQSLS